MAYPYQAPPEEAGSSTNHERSGVLEIPSRRGTGAGALLVLLGIWGGIIPFIGPLFDYRMDSLGAWEMSWDRLLLNILPGIAVLLGGIMLIIAADRISASAATWLALAGGAWFLIGPSASLLWGSSVDASVGTGSNVERFLVQLGYFYGLGAVIVALAAGSWARVMVRTARDSRLLERSDDRAVTQAPVPAPPPRATAPPREQQRGAMPATAGATAQGRRAPAPAPGTSGPPVPRQASAPPDQANNQR